MNKALLNAFKGEKAILEYLNPESNTFTPLVELPKSLNPYHKDGVKLYAKLLNTLPLTNVKSISAFNMLTELNRQGKIEDTHTIIENSSGNTALSLSVIGKLLEIPKTKAYVSYEVLYGKLQMLQLFGVEPIINKEPICPDPADKTSGIYKAKRLGEKRGWLNPGQYENTANPKGHKKITGPQIFKQMKGDIQLICAGLGTTGTMVGTAGYLKEKIKNIKSLGVIRTPNNPVPGVRTRGLLNMIAFDWRTYVDYIEEVGTKDSFLQSLNLIRHGIVAGPSSGFALAGLLNFLNKLKDTNSLKTLANTNGIINAVFICSDSPFPYLKDYFEYLDKSNFPEIKNYDLLIDKPESCDKPTAKINIKDHEIEPLKAFSQFFYINNKNAAKKKLITNENLTLKNNHLIIDARSIDEFNHYHLPGSIHINYANCIKPTKKLISEYKLKNKKILIVCNLGLKSYIIANLLKTEKINAHCLKGGITEWSNLNLPRWKPAVCYKNQNTPIKLQPPD